MFTLQIEESIRVGGELIFYILIIIFAFHALFLGYHWFTYGDSRKISTVALATYLLGGALLFMTLSVTLMTM